MKSYQSIGFVATLAALFMVIVGVTARDCSLTRQQIEEEPRIWIYTDNTNHKALWRWDQMPGRGKVSLMCRDPQTTELECRVNGRLNHALPMTGCNNPMRPVVQEIQDPACDHKTYRVGYELERSGDFLEIYRSCYDHQRLALVYTTHMTAYHPLPTGRPDVPFVTDNIITGAEAASFLNSHVYDRFEELLGPNQRYVTKGSLFMDRGHLVPSADFLFPGSMRATFKYINAIPQFGSINKGNWKNVETWVRDQVRPGNKVWVITGATGVLELYNKRRQLVPMYLLPNNKNPIPKWIFKIVTFDNNRRMIFMTYNNPFTANSPPPTPLPCVPLACPSSLTLNNNRRYGFTICCDPNKPTRIP